MIYSFAYRIKIIYADENWEYKYHIVIHNISQLPELINDIQKDYIYWVEDVEVEAIKYYNDNELDEKVLNMWKFYRRELDFVDWGDIPPGNNWIVRRKKNKKPPWEEYYNEW